VGAAGHAPCQPEEKQGEDRVAALHVPAHPRAADLPGDIRKDDEEDERPMERARGQIPLGTALHRGIQLLRLVRYSSWQALHAESTSATAFFSAPTSPLRATCGSLDVSFIILSILASKSARLVQISGLARVSPAL